MLMDCFGSELFVQVRNTLTTFGSSSVRYRVIRFDPTLMIYTLYISTRIEYV